MGLNKVLITSSTTWTAPSGVTEVMLIGCGGGGGGGAGKSGSNNPTSQNAGGGGGAGAIVSNTIVSVTPGNSYSIVIGDGGVGGVFGNFFGAPGNNGSLGGDTSFGTLATFLGASGGQGGGQGSNGEGAGGRFSTEDGTNLYSPFVIVENVPFVFNDNAANGGTSYNSPSDPTIVVSSPGISNTVSMGNEFLPGSGGNQGISFASFSQYLGGGGGSGGGAGPAGNGGDGGNGGVGKDPNSFINEVDAASSGDSALPNSGAGGGGGGGGGNGQSIENIHGANGGNGGSGFLYVIWTDTGGGGFTAGGDLTGDSVSQTVAKLQGSTLSAPVSSGSANKVLHGDNSGTLNWGAVNLANDITGVLPTSNQSAQTMGGDVTGTTATSTVAKINATTITTAGGSLATGKVLRVTGTASADWGAVDLADTDAVTGTLPTGNQASQTMAGDVTGTTAASVVAKVNGATVPAAGTLVTGNVPQVTGASALSYGAINLAGGANFVTGVLPEANQTDQTMSGDVTGSTGASVVSKIAALGGGGTVLVAVDNDGDVISGGTAPGSPDPFAFLQTITENLVASSAVKNYDFDLTASEYTNKQIRFKARGYATTKDTGGVAGSNLTGSAYVVTDAVYQNANGGVSLVTAAAGGAANPMPAINNEMTLEPQVCNGLQSGGGSPPNLAWTLVSNTTARLQLTATNNANRGSWEIDIYRRVKAAP